MGAGVCRTRERPRGAHTPPLLDKSQRRGTAAQVACARLQDPCRPVHSDWTVHFPGTAFQFSVFCKCIFFSLIFRFSPIFKFVFCSCCLGAIKKKSFYLSPICPSSVIASARDPGERTSERTTRDVEDTGTAQPRGRPGGLRGPGRDEASFLQEARFAMGCAGRSGHGERAERESETHTAARPQPSIRDGAGAYGRHRAQL